MTKFIIHNKLIITAIAISFTSLAEQPDADELVGKIYGGIHAMHIETDNDRLITADPKSDMDNGNGLGFEIGYRWLPSTEFRLSHSRFNLNSRHAGYPEPDGLSTSIDAMYFPTNKNFYLLTGVNSLDIGNSQISGNLGAGYRHYLSQKSAVYFETKANYQFSERYDELTAQLGVVYFFGEKAKVQPLKVEPLVIRDSDNDGVQDNADQCPNTPMIDQVDHKGCTVFIQREESIRLLVNFDNNSNKVKDEYLKEIKALADFMMAHPETSVTIEGHASSPGYDIYNKTLSQKRADAIIYILINKYKINLERLTALGYGEEQLINTENTQAAHAQNRRTTAKITVKKKTAVKR